MQNERQILRSKLLPPNPSGILKRDRLYPVLSEIKKKKILTVVAGAGYGKTTLIAEACSLLKLDAVWYRLDKTDTDFTAFILYLIEGIKQYYPDFGKKTLARIGEAEISSQGRHAIASAFLSEIEETVKNNLTIILDDYHLIESPEIAKSLEFIIDLIPRNIHLIIISRTDPGLPLARLRAGREALFITEEELSFTLQETGQLYTQIFNISMRSPSLKSLHNKTNGWISGLILFYHSLRGRSIEEIDLLLKKLSGSHKFISDYLEENVYSLMPPEIKSFMIRSSILSRINPEFCDELMDISNSGDILKQLENNHLFTFSYDEEKKWYYYHHLLRDFLKTKLSHEMKNNIISLHKKAAALWEKRKEEEEALRHYIDAREYGKANTLLSGLSGNFFREGRINLIISYINEIPEAYINKEPWLIYNKARVLEITGKRNESIQTYRKALRIFRKSGDLTGIGASLFALGLSYGITGDFLMSEKKLKELMAQVRSDTGLQIGILGSLIFVTAHQAKMSAADRYFMEAMSLAPSSKDSADLSWIYFAQGFRHGFDGNFSEALKFGKDAEEICEKYGQYHLLGLNYHLISWSYYFLGYFTEGMNTASKGMEMVRERGYQDTSRAWLLADSALNSMALGKTSDALRDIEECLNIMRGQGSVWGQSWAYYIISDLSMKTGMTEEAEKYAKTGLELIRISGMALPLQKGALKIKLAESLIERGRLHKARPLMDDLNRYLRKSGFLAVMIYFLRTGYYIEKKDNDSALINLMSALDICETNKFDIRIFFNDRLTAPLVELFARGKMRGYIVSVFRKTGSNTRKELLRLQKSKSPGISDAAAAILGEISKLPPPGLKIYCLGEFRVFRCGREIPAPMWKSKKARSLFKYLVHNRHRGYTSKDILMELLWPDEDPRVSSARLQDALWSLRKTLEPEIERGTPSSYLIRDADSYRIVLGEDGSVDTDSFSEEINLAEKTDNHEDSIGHYLKAEALYRGDFLEEDPYTDWCIEKKQTLREKYLILLENIMKYYERRQEYSKSIEYAGKYLKADKYAENIYRKLMNYYSLTGSMSMAAMTFEKCRENLKDIDSPLSGETLDLYNRLTAG